MRERHSSHPPPKPPALHFIQPLPVPSSPNGARALLVNSTICNPRFAVARVANRSSRLPLCVTSQFRPARPSTSPPSPLPQDDATVLISTVADPEAHSDNNQVHDQSPPPHHNRSSASDSESSGKQRNLSSETRKKISYSLLGRPKSLEMRAKVSAAMKGRKPWNKGKKLSPETRARMSEAHIGLRAWNKGRRLSSAHRKAISESSTNSPRALSVDTRRRMRMARRRPGDPLVAGTASHHLDHGSYSLVDSSEINEYVSLRRELRVWSDRFYSRNGRRPTLADVRRLAAVPVMRKFETYVAMRDRIRGLANDVCDTVDPENIPATSAGDLMGRSSESKAEFHITKHGNRRMVYPPKTPTSDQAWYDSTDATLVGAVNDMWDAYDRPSSSEDDVSDSKALDHSLIGTHELTPKTEHLSPNDYRKIGRHRLIETMDINRFVNLRKELKDWSASFKKEHGRTPSVSDARNSGRPVLYSNICEFLELREKMKSLMNEVYGTEVDDVETLSKVSAEGKQALRALRENSDHDSEDGHNSHHSVKW